MAVTASLYGNFLIKLLAGTAPVSADSLKLMLCTSSYVPNKDTHVFKSDVTNEASGSGYTAGGMALTGKTVAYDAPSDTVTFDANDVVWPTTAVTARIAVLYDDTPVGDGNKPLVGYIDFGTDRQSFLPGSFTVAFNTSGIFTLLAA